VTEFRAGLFCAPEAGGRRAAPETMAGWIHIPDEPVTMRLEGHLARAVQDSGAQAMRVTPWRALLLLGATPGPHAGLEWDADAPVLRADACPGAPFCPQATVETRALARALAPHVPGSLHVSGCAKGCARVTPADLCVIGHDGHYDLARNAVAGDNPAQTGLTAIQVLDQFGAA
jgi:precorrin-3B synthase